MVPRAGEIVGAGCLLEDLPGEDIGAVEACQPQLAGGGIEAVVAIPSIGSEHEPGGARFVVELHPHGDLIRKRRGGCDGEAERAAAKASADAFDSDPAGALPPAGAADGRPFLGIERADRQPTVDADRIRPVDERLELIDADGEAEERRHERLHREDPVHLPLPVEERPAAVPWLDRDRQLDHRPAVDLALPRNAPRDNAPLEAVRIADGHHLLAVEERLGDAERKRREPLLGDPYDCQVGGPVGGMDRGDVVPAAVGKLHAHRPRLADDVIIGGDQSIGRDHKPGAEPLIATAAAGKPDRDDRVSNLLGDRFDGVHVRLHRRLRWPPRGRLSGVRCCHRCDRQHDGHSDDCPGSKKVPRLAAVSLCRHVDRSFVAHVPGTTPEPPA